MKIRIAAFLGVLILAGVAGTWLGGMGGAPEDGDAPERRANPAPAASDSTQAAAPKPEAAAADRPAAPLYFYAPAAGAADAAAVAAERDMAVAAGFTRWIAPVPLPWPGQEQAVESLLPVLQELAERYPAVRVLFHVNVNPPADWLTANPQAQVVTNGAARPYAAPDDPAYLAAAETALGTLIKTIAEADEDGRVMGYIVSGLHNGYWHFEGDGDRSPAAVAAFRTWLTERYGGDEALREAWGSEDVTLADAAIPAPWAEDSTAEAFFTFPEHRDRSDFLRFQSDRVAGAINRFARYVKDTAGDGMLVYAPYGFTFELPGPAAGHGALEAVLASAIDGVAQPVSLATRVIGATGGYMGPVNTGNNSRKRWLILDDTRTGIATSMQENAGEGPPAARLESIYNVQRRNFAAALTNDLELAWCDVTGQGQLRDETMWRNFAALRVVYEDALIASRANAGQYRIYDLRPEGRTSIMVVADEESLYTQQAGTALTNRLLRDVRDAALHSGSPAQFCLLSDVLADRAAAADVYIFANTFVLPEADRQRLHAILAREKAVAIWLYAPGYFSPEADADHIAATTLMEVEAFDESAESGSRFDLAGTLLKKDAAFGDGSMWSPLFHIEPSEAVSPIAYYTSGDGDRISAAAFFAEDGWTSIYLAEPTLTDIVLRELLRILEVPSIFAADPVTLTDTAYFSRDIVAVHSQEGGERNFTFAWEYDIVDAAQAARAALAGSGQDNVAGWFGKRVIDLKMPSGETRILRVSPVATPAN